MITTEDILRKCLVSIELFDDRKSTIEYLLVGILYELIEINKKLPEPPKDWDKGSLSNRTIAKIRRKSKKKVKK
jgi:hypothetical protein